MFFKFKLQNYKRCEKCSKESPEDDAKFCIFCGKELNHPAKQKLLYIYDKNPAIIAAFLAKMAKLDNASISRDLSRFISSLLDKIDLFYSKDYGDFRSSYAEVFALEKSGGRSISKLCSCMRISSQQEVDFLICILLDLAYFDKQMSDSENTLIESIIIGLGLNLIVFRELKIKYEQIYHFTSKEQNRQKQENDSKMTLKQAYEILKSREDDSFETIKKNYRKLAREYHYDNLYSKELPPELLKIAQEMMKKINLAYEIIKEARGV